MKIKSRILTAGAAAAALTWIASCSSTDLTGNAAKKSNTNGDKVPGTDDGADGGNDTDQNGVDAGIDAGGDPTTGRISTTAVDGEKPVGETTDSDGSADTIFENSENGQRREIFAYGGTSKSPLVDYLFVIDNSPSMENNVTRLREGISSLSADLFPKRTRLGVMNTMPAAVDDPNKSFNGAQQQPAIAANSEPGFMGLLNKERIDSYKSASGSNSKQFTMPGCDKAWFAPGDKDSAGNRCFDAATQISLRGGPCESGLVALKQLIEKMGTKTLFRKGAAVNVVYVSDTHDPGCDAAHGGTKLIAIRPDFNALKEQVEKNTPAVTAFKVHGIFPKRICEPTSENTFKNDLSYEAVVTAAKGQSLDLCDTSDFKGVVEQIIGSAAAEKAVFKLSKAPKQIVIVSVNGRKTDDYVLEGDVVRVNGLSGTQESKIQVYYKPQ